jgi:flagellar biosynthesis anti-sigma factor FlgM
MEIRNTADDLRALLGVTPSTTSGTQQVRAGSASAKGALAGDHATLSGAATEVALGAADDAVRLNKVKEVREALAAGVYQVPAEAVASKLVDAMLSVRTGE